MDKFAEAAELCAAASDPQQLWLPGVEKTALWVGLGFRV